MFIVVLILSLSDTFEIANKLYNEGKYDYALQKYEYLVCSGIRNHTVYYNLGNCYFKTGKIGKAILFYKHAQKLKPADSDINFNLNFARARRVDELKISKPPKAIKIFLTLLKSPNINTLLIISTTLYFGLVALICIGLFVKVKYGKKLKIVLCIILVITLAILFGNIRRINRQEGVLLEKVAEIRSGPSEDYTLIFTIHEGMEMKILEGQKDWLKIVLPDGLLGWVKTSQIGKI